MAGISSVLNYDLLQPSQTGEIPMTEKRDSQTKIELLKIAAQLTVVQMYGERNQHDEVLRVFNHFRDDLFKEYETLISTK